MIHTKTILIATSLLLASCSTSKAVTDGAKLSAAELSKFQTQLSNYSKKSNRDTANRLERLSSELEADTALAIRRENQAYVGLAGDKTLTAIHKELADQVAMLAAQDARTEALQRTFDSRLAELTVDLSIASGPFKEAQEALAKLADPKAQRLQLGFIAKYARSVAEGLEAERKALETPAAAPDASPAAPAQ